MKRVPASAHKCTPIQLKATAGLRLLGKERADAILDAVYTLFKQFPFVVTSRDAVIVMDGKDEGPYAWMTVNFLLKSLTNSAGAAKTAAVLDMGGASTQIVFRPDDESVMDSVTADRTYHVATEGYATRVYTHSHLGYGLKQAGKQMMAAAAKHGDEKAFSCFPKGTSEKIDGVTASNTEGAEQSFGKCLAVAEGILQKDKTCPTTSCSFNGIPQPALPGTFTGQVYAFSYFFDRMEPFLGPEGGVSSVGALKAMAEGVCEGTEAKYTAHNKGTYCMDLAYLYAILKTGYDMSDSTELHIRKKINGIETAWTLGAMMAAMKA
jgi:guanosine-diphosphatase